MASRWPRRLNSEGSPRRGSRQRASRGPRRLVLQARPVTIPLETASNLPAGPVRMAPAGCSRYRAGPLVGGEGMNHANMMHKPALTNRPTCDSITQFPRNPVCRRRGVCPGEPVVSAARQSGPGSERGHWAIKPRAKVENRAPAAAPGDAGNSIDSELWKEETSSPSRARRAMRKTRCTEPVQPVVTHQLTHSARRQPHRREHG